MQKTEPDADQIGKYIPTVVRKRMYLLNDIVRELNRRKFRSLDETKPDDLKKIISLIEDMHPESTYYKAREYARVAIKIWRNQRKT